MLKESDGAEDRVENLDEGRHRSLGKMLQGLVRDTIWARGLTDLKPLMAS
jgi:hypothetical protein